MDTFFEDNIQSLGIPTLLLGFAGIAFCYIISNRNQLQKASKAFKYLNITIATDVAKCDEVILELRRRLIPHRTVGFDCEWVAINGKRNPVSLIQLSTYDGYCALFRINHIKHLPESLKDLLEDTNIYKVGVVPGDDAKYLYHDYSVALRSTLDIRHIVHMCGFDHGGLASLAKSQLGVILDKNWRIRCSNWEADELTPEQVRYAAADAHVAIKIFVNLINNHSNTRMSLFFRRRNNEIWNNLDELCRQYTDINFKSSKPVILTKSRVCDKVKKNRVIRHSSISVRSKPLYHNCYLEAPDGEVLCTCDIRKAMWYKERQLGDIVREDPLTVRLRFEPSGRASGTSGEYYRLVKRNVCVVCGANESYLRKNVVPKEYRKYFPDVMKDHSCHDVVLLCRSCHQRSNISDQAMRERLAREYDAPLSDARHTKHTTDFVARKVRYTAKTLLNMAEKIPEYRRKEMEKIVLAYFEDHTEVTTELLQKASAIEYLAENEEYEAHGLRVVERFVKEGGLLRLERLWRQHFLNTMNPRHLPSLWSLDHNGDRLRIRLQEGRLSEDEIKSIGLTSCIDELQAVKNEKQSQ